MGAFDKLLDTVSACALLCLENVCGMAAGWLAATGRRRRVRLRKV
jgi:hypothetical protein